MNPLTFDEAYSQLEKIVRDIEQEQVPLDELAARVKDAKLLITYCENKLRSIETELQSLAGDENAAPGREG
jgi:exodeoxyribonuclease VII small subunit